MCSAAEQRQRRRGNPGYKLYFAWIAASGFVLFRYAAQYKTFLAMTGGGMSSYLSIYFILFFRIYSAYSLKEIIQREMYCRGDRLVAHYRLISLLVIFLHLPHGRPTGRPYETSYFAK